MANLGFVNILAWPPDQVANWLKGLADVIHPFVPRFVEVGIDGSRLLSLTHSDLAELGIDKLGHQELILEAIDLLIQLHYELETTNLQSLALLTSCRARSLYCSLQSSQNGPAWISKNDHGISSVSQLTLVSQLVVAVKKLTSWIDRPPFDILENYIKMRNQLLSLTVTVIEATISHNHLLNKPTVIQTCQQVCELCDTVVQSSKDSLIIQPTLLELATIRKKADEELGLNIQSVHGVHVIGIVKDQSPSQQCGRVEEGDEVVQVNYETVVGWELSRLVVALKENQREVTLTLKKRPRHVPLDTAKRHRKKVADVPGTFPKSSRRSHHGSKKKAHDELQHLLVPPQFGDSVKADTDDEAETETAVKRRESSTLAVDGEMGEPIGRPRRATVSGSGSRPSLRAKQLLVLQQQEGRPKSCVVTSGGEEAAAGGTHRSLPTSNLPSPEHLAVAGGAGGGGGGAVANGGANKVKPLTPGEEQRLNRLLTGGTVANNSSIQDPLVASDSLILVASVGPDSGAAALVDSVFGDELTPTPHSAAVVTLLESPMSDSVASKHSSPQKVVLGAGDQQNNGTSKSSQHQNIVSDSPSKLFRQTPSTTLAGVTSDKDTPQLVGITPVNSVKRAQQWGQQPTDANTTASQTKSPQYLQPDSSSLQSARSGTSPKLSPRFFRRAAPAAAETPAADSGSTSSHHGSPAKSSVSSIQSDRISSDSTKSASPGLLRKKFTGSTSRLLGEKRRVSCKDLGHGDCQGYLLKLKEGVFSRWVTKWCVVKDYHLYLYDSPESVKANGIIDLRAFKVSPASESEAKQKKYAFKVHHSGTNFIFASERLEDMRKWMEKMGMSAIGYDMSVTTLAGFVNAPIIEGEAAYSESDDDDALSHNSASNRGSIEDLKTQLQRDPLTAVLSQIHGADVDLSGTDLKIKRTQTLGKKHSARRKRHVELALKLGGLERTLKDKENELLAIEALLLKDVLTGEELQHFLNKDSSTDQASQSPSKDSNSSSDGEV